MEQIFLALFLTICSVTDILRKQIYIKVVVPFFAIGLTLFFINGRLSIIEELGGVFLGIIVLLLARASHERIGYGDALMIIVSGTYLGMFMNIRLLMWALFISAITSAVLLMLKRVNRNTELPFAPFMLTAFFFMTIIQGGLT